MQIGQNLTGFSANKGIVIILTNFNNLTQAQKAIAPGWDDTPVTAAVPFEFQSGLGLLLSLAIVIIHTISKQKNKLN